MGLTIDELKKHWNPGTICDITGIKEPVRWEYYFTKLFPEHEFTACWVGRLKKIEGELSSRAGCCLLFMQRTDERFRTFRLYWDMFTFQFQDGKIELFIVPAFSSEIRAKIEEQHLAGKDWIEIVYGQPDEKKEVTVTCVPKTFDELNLVIAREFTQEEMRTIDNAEIQKQIDLKMKEAEELKAKMEI